MSVQELSVDLIRLSPFNTRGEISDEDLESLVQSIRETGLVEPLKVRTVLDGAYELVSGERRLRAMKILSVEHASCTVREMSDVEVLLEQWAENEEREDLSDYGKALKLRQILDALKITQDELADKLGKTKGWVSQHLSILKLGKKFTSVNLHDLTDFQAQPILSSTQ
jgi:ParB family chromosome partitioning protein